MNNTIYKYSLHITDRQLVPLPCGAVPLTAQFQDDHLCLWSQVDSAQRSLEPLAIVIIGTGHPVEDFGLLTYLATAQHIIGGTPLAWHIFTEKR